MVFRLLGYFPSALGANDFAAARTHTHTHYTTSDVSDFTGPLLSQPMPTPALLDALTRGMRDTT